MASLIDDLYQVDPGRIGETFGEDTEAETFEQQYAAYMMMLQAGDNLQDTLDAVAEERDESNVCVSPAGINFRSIALAEMLDRLQNQEEGSETDQRLRELGKQLQMRREAREMSRQLLSNLSGVSRDVIFCLEHGMLGCNDVKKYVPVLAQFLAQEDH